MGDMGQDQRIGAAIAGYRIEGLLGRGGMSVVYVAEHLRLGRRVALKLLAPDLAPDERFRERFVRESRLAASLEHPNIIPIYDADEADGHLYIAMRLVEGTDLKALLEQEGRLEAERALAIVGQVGNALDAAHARGLVHRDVKPGNILIARDPRPGVPEHVYLSDFGLTKRISSESGLTATGQFVGTLDYAAPEQFEGKKLDARTDVYSLGCVLYQCLTGEVPFRRDQEAALMYAHLLSAPPKVTSTRPDLPAAIDDVVARAMAKSPDDRQPTAGQMVEEARGAVGGDEAGRPPEVSAAVKARPAPRRRRPALIASISLLGVAAVVVVIVLATRAGNKPGPAPASHAGALGQGTLVRVDPVTGRVAGRVTVGKKPVSIAIGGGSIWVANSLSNTVTRIDAKTDRVVATISVGHNPVGVAFGQEIPGVWVITDDGLWRINPVTNAVAATIPLPAPGTRIAAGAGGVWVTVLGPLIEGLAGGFLLKVDPSSDAIVQQHEVGGDPGPVEVAADNGSVWLVLRGSTGGNPSTLLRIDPTAVTEIASIALTEANPAVAAATGQVWLVAPDGSLSMIDPSTNKEVATYGVGGGANALAIGDGSVWVLNGSLGTMLQVNAADGSVTRTITVANHPAALAVGEGAVWTVTG